MAEIENMIPKPPPNPPLTSLITTPFMNIRE